MEWEKSGGIHFSTMIDAPTFKSFPTPAINTDGTFVFSASETLVAIRQRSRFHLAESRYSLRTAFCASSSSEASAGGRFRLIAKRAVLNRVPSSVDTGKSRSSPVLTVRDLLIPHSYRSNVRATGILLAPNYNHPDSLPHT